jgi:dCTP deaminase
MNHDSEPPMPSADMSGAASSVAVQPHDFEERAGLMASQTIRRMVARGVIQASLPVENNQYQPASLDLRLGARAYRVRASFLSGRERGVSDQLVRSQLDELFFLARIIK